MRWAGALLLAGCVCNPPRASRATIERELLDPYRDALVAREWTLARERFTTPGYRRDTPPILYEAAQARNHDEFGDGLRIEMTADDPIPVTEPGLPELLRITVRWRGEGGDATVVLDLVDGPPWRIERSWVWPEHGVATPRVF